MKSAENDIEAKEFNAKILKDENLKKHYLEFNIKKHPIDNTLFFFQVNNITLEMPMFPVLYDWKEIHKEKICSNQPPCDKGALNCSCIFVLEFDLNDVVELVLSDNGFLTPRSTHPCKNIY